MLENKIDELINALTANTSTMREMIDVLVPHNSPVTAQLDDIQPKRAGRPPKEKAPIPEEVIQEILEKTTPPVDEPEPEVIEPRNAFEEAVRDYKGPMTDGNGKEVNVPFEVIKNEILAIAKKNRPAAEALLASFGVPKISQLTVDQYPAAYEAAQKALA